MTVPFAIEGRVANSEKSGHTVRVEDDRRDTGGFFIYERWQGSDGPNAQSAYDAWVETEDELESFFAEAGWIVDWRTLNADEQAIEEAKSLARQVVAGRIDPAEGCARIAKLCAVRGWPAALMSFAALAHEQDGHPEFGLTRENTAPLILEACRELLGDEREG
ncbi:MAG: hypothetical protein AAB403_09510 [Planctomycetota bacterium]